LAAALRATPDPRAKNRTYPLGAVLCVIAMALLTRLPLLDRDLSFF
jgi:hypothetical protein